MTDPAMGETTTTDEPPAEEATMQDVVEDTPPDDATTTQLLDVATEVRARIGTALVSTSDAAELATQLPPFVARAVLRSLSQAHRHLADAEVMTSSQAVASAHVVNLTAADATRRVLCTCGLAFTPAGWNMHLSGAGADPGATHAIAGELVAPGGISRRRTVELLVDRSAELMGTPTRDETKRRRE